MSVLLGKRTTTAVTVSIEGITEPATFKHLPDALAALWESLRVLPLGAVQADAYQYFLTRPDAVERVTEFLTRDGRLDLSFALVGWSHLVTIQPAAA
ncbi:hypothetical protein F4556_003312 [Kitasatospora gansuensis]|uniref:Uncharacterized protein n=1 Tax=Kitasatospora gansuensis TaxID=258050 RepID=A0A7W7SCI9_9ACTN|nr:hypothetical protein [Kitasatospora gansuensis]MBB4947777.1 hypothetical protein [Kitasatospora gansuensis]